mmetsp:Transcript_13465/g.29243  ORF Transcript_13465/g.29243 Transcript_13465/m.29243 type:complete len:218 (-) Transcript_13465:198-851(-)
MNAIRSFAAWALVGATVSAFQPTGPNRMTKSSPLQRHLSISLPNRHHFILHQSTQVEEEEEEEMEFIFVSPEQISFLRKEANQREANKKLPKHFLPAEESKEVSQETVDEISKLFESSELIEVRGVSRDQKKQVFDTGYGLAATLEDVFEKPVVVVDIKGFAVKLYCPWDDEEQVGRIQLRTNYRPGQWKRKAKAIRDNRGQVILDENGKTIKEIPE